MKKWFCDSCGFIAESENQPDVCSRCKSAKFILQEDNKDLTDVSLFSREVHGIMKLDSLLIQVMETCDKSTHTNTCDNCTTIFAQVKENVAKLKEITKNEIQSHIRKGNWG